MSKTSRVLAMKLKQWPVTVPVVLIAVDPDVFDEVVCNFHFFEAD